MWLSEPPAGKRSRRGLAGAGTGSAELGGGKTASSPAPFSAKQIALLETFANQAVIAIENVRLFTELQEKNRALTQAHAQVTESLEQQTATSEILRVIASSPTDTLPVFDTIAQRAVRVCDGTHCVVTRFDGALIHIVAHHGLPAELLEEFRRIYPVPLAADSLPARAIREGTLIHSPDLLNDPSERVRRLAQVGRYRSGIVVPMLRSGSAVGVISVARGGPDGGPRPYTEKEITLLQTFADQGVIAIENVRLFQELEVRNRDLTEALEQQTATSEILRVISQSPTDAQPVFDAIARSALRLCEGGFSVVNRYDGELLHLSAHAHASPEGVEVMRQIFPMSPSRINLAGRVILTGAVVHVPDVQADAEYGRMISQTLGNRSSIGVPMMRDGHPIGAIMVGRLEVRPFSDAHIALLQTFADQAVIAIENVRLFQELEQRNRELTETLEQQTATSEILRVIANSPTDVQPVFDAIVRHAGPLCRGIHTIAVRLAGNMVTLAAHNAPSAAAREHVSRQFPAPLDAVSRGMGLALIEGQVVQEPDIDSDAEYPPVSREAARIWGYRARLVVPMLREGRPIGAIAVGRSQAGAFSSHEIALLQTFAAQAVIAIENVRLFNETKEALEQQTATAEILRVIASSPTDLQSALEAVAERAARLCESSDAIVFRVHGDELRPAAVYGAIGAVSNAISPGFVTGRAVLERRTIHVEDLAAAVAADFPDAAEHQRRFGHRTTLATPLLREGVPIGAITIRRLEVRPFTEGQVRLLETFADQAVIAIENVRLFKELEARTQDLTRSVAELRALGDVSRALSSTLDLDTVLQTIVTRASQLAGTDACTVYEYDAGTEAFHLRATHNLDAEVVALARRTPTRTGEGIQGRMAVTRQPVQIPDITVEDAYRGPLRDILLRTGTRAVLAIPMLREDELIGGFTVNKKTPGAFAPEVIELLQTFATQSALAIQNARLFHEIADKGRQLEAASHHKSEFLANMSHELRTPLNAILGFSEVLAERMFGEVNAKQAEYLQDILSSGRHLLSLINDILDLAKVEAGRLELELGRFHLPTALDNALTLVRERAARHGITLTQTVDERLGDIVADDRKVKQILLNLLSNAVKFTPEGGRVGLTATAAESVVTIAVSDTGIGIAPEDQAAIFEEFRQVGRDDTRTQEGTGLV